MTTESSSITSTTMLSFEELPSQVLSAILSGFCSGKTISTFLLTVARSNHHLRPGALSLCRGVLVQRFVELANKFVGEPEIKDVIDVIREDCRLSQQDDDEDDDDEHSSVSVVTKMSEWCAILDYFEIHLRVAKEMNNNNNMPHHVPLPTLLWIVWSGTLQIPYGETHGYLSTSNWAAGAMQYWRNRELTHLSLTHTRNSSLVRINLPFYALFLGLGDDDDRRLHLQNGVLEHGIHIHDDDDENGPPGLLSARSSLVPADEVYEVNPTMALGPQKRSQTRQQDEILPSVLECYWDSQDGEEGDWEETVARLGESAIRVMSLTNGVEGRGFESFVKSAYSNWRLYDCTR